MDCLCPKPPELVTVPNSDCPENLNQIIRLFFQRPGFTFVSPGSLPTVAASWTPLLTAADDTKLVVSPYLENVVITRPEKITRGGGDNSTLRGIEKIMGYNPAVLTAMLTSMKGEIIKAMKALQCESLVMYMQNEYDKIIGYGTPTAFTGITIYSVGVSDAGNDGYASDDMAELSLSMPYGWRDSLVIITPAFNPNTVIKAA